MKKAVVIGSINMDVILKVDHLPKAGETIIAKEMKIAGGGKGANQAIAISRLGGDVYMIGKVGDDEYGRNLINNLKESGVDTSGVINDINKKTGTAYIVVESTSENSIIVAPGANSNLSTRDIGEKIEIVLNSDIVILQMEIPKQVISHVIYLAKKLRKLIVLNFAPAINIDIRVLQQVDFLILNEIEMLILAGLGDFKTIEKQSINEAIRCIRNKFIGELIITLGSDGCVWVNK